MNATTMTTDGSIITYPTGIRFYPLEPSYPLIHIEDIAHALSMQCRFNGYVKSFYSVAEHSVHVLDEVKKDTHQKHDLLWALLHDASEAYMVDIPKPIKERIPGIKEIEDRISKAVAHRFGLPVDIPDVVHRHDKLLCAEEKLALRDGKKSKFLFNCWPSELAAKIFLRRFNVLQATL